MQVSQSIASGTAKYQVLIATASESTLRLLQPLQQVTQAESVAESGGLFRPQQRLVFQGLDYHVVDTVVRSRMGDRPVGVVIVDLQPGTESKTEQILNALYYAEPTLSILVLLADGASLSKPFLDLITHSPRLSFLQMPASLAQVYQALKLMVAGWQANHKLAEIQAARAQQETAAAAQPTPTSAATESGSAMHLEVVGSLAAGISHEFNNVLTVIQSQMDMALQQAGDLPHVVDLLTQVMDTARSASALSKKLVSFTPEEESAPAALDVPTAVNDEVALLAKTLGEHISLEVNHGSHLPVVWISPATLSQLIINVALHARNSMPQGGVLQFSTSKIHHQTGSKYARLFPEAAHKEYVMLTIEDPNPTDATVEADPRHVVVSLPSIVQRAADDRLAWIQRALQKAGGAFNVTLLPGMIRTYQMLLPLAEVAVETEETTVPVVSRLETGPVVPSTVLVVDDDDTICMIMSQVLATEKHRVIIAKSADEAWQQWCQNRSTIKLLITDINMPGGANGVALGHAIQEQDGSVPVIYTSGHRAVHQFAELEIGTNYLPKPFGMNDLLTVANRALASHAHHGLS